METILNMAAEIIIFSLFGFFLSRLSDKLVNAIQSKNYDDVKNHIFWETHKNENARNNWQITESDLKNEIDSLQSQLKHQKQILEGADLNIQEALQLKNEVSKELRELKEIHRATLDEMGALKGENKWMRNKLP